MGKGRYPLPPQWLKKACRKRKEEGRTAGRSADGYVGEYVGGALKQIKLVFVFFFGDSRFQVPAICGK